MNHQFNNKIKLYISIQKVLIQISNDKFTEHLNNIPKYSQNKLKLLLVKMMKIIKTLK